MSQQRETLNSIGKVAGSPLHDITQDLLAERIVAPSRRDVERFEGRDHLTGTRGYNLWDERNRRLRHALEPLGWAYRSEQNIPRLVSLDEKVQVVITRGDDRTGRKGGPGPRSVLPRGNAMVQLLKGNEPYSGFEELALPSDEIGFNKETWFFIFHETSSETLVELSLPTFDGRDNFGAFLSRKIFDPIPHTTTLGRDPNEGSSGRTIDFDVISLE